ncbi:putative transcription factor MYC/MYB, GAF domain-containing protein [Lupinus albus]|uniref:Putative transcription factor MYC/MYB, GAF domain-containing protein n=1 Tax=Lupinus albus TaxID=3870 RepID=A0A6A4R0Z9_LUPAL|nr:putative transcription factor MYC/MYB, GAF domain-containing protein [Lupinus albus]
MAMVESLTLRNKLKALCLEDGWSYAIFWRFHPHNPFLLTAEDAYYEAQLGQEIPNMLPQTQLFGEGIVGKAAFTGKHIWVHSDSQSQEWNLCSQNIYKTIVAIPIIACGVVQFGSKKKILERVDFLEQIQRLLMDMENVGMVDMSGNAVSLLDCENYDLNSLLASFSSENSYDSTFEYAHGENSEDLMRKFYSYESDNNSFPSLYNVYNEGVTSFHGDSCVGDQLNATNEAQVALYDTDFTNVLLRPNSLMNNVISNDTSFGAWNGEVSFFDSFEQQLVSADENTFSCSEIAVQDPALSSMYSMNIGTCQEKLQSALSNRQSSQSDVVTGVDFPSSSNALHGLSKNIEAVDMSEEFLKFGSSDDLCHWFAPSPDDNNFIAITALDNTPSESIEFNPTSFVRVGNSSLSNIPVTCSAGANSIETSAVMHTPENSFFDFNRDQTNDWWENMPTPALSPAIFSECISELNTSTLTGTHNGLLFSEPLEYELSPNKRKVVEFAPLNINAIQFGNIVRPAKATSDLMDSISHSEKTNNLVRKKDTLPKLQVPRWIDDGHSINNGKAVPAHQKTQKPEEGTTKRTKKRARPKESTRPRPKDRQQIQDCIKELRGIIPNGEKLIEQANEVALEDSNVGDNENFGVTWAVDLASPTMECPIIVEDMNTPGQMRIEFLCEGQEGVFGLGIGHNIESIGLKTLKAEMKSRENKLWAVFIVEIVKQGNRHWTRQDVFYFILNLIQQAYTSNMDSANDIANVIDPIDSWLRQSPEKQ